MKLTEAELDKNIKLCVGMLAILLISVYLNGWDYPLPFGLGFCWMKPKWLNM